VTDPRLDGMLAGARTGDEVSTRQLYQLLNPPMLRYLRHRAPTVAEDLAADVWTAAVEVLAHFEGDAEEFRGWLFTVARRRIADHYRRRGQRPESVQLQAIPEPTAPLGVEDQVIEAMSAQDAVAILVRSLSPDQAEVILLRVLGGLPVAQVAAIMGRSAGAIRVLQHRAIERLSRVYREVVDA
jgi:RNA polymerase sigma-70 factor, ECF subfamily